jgi:hypothetical protein
MTLILACALALGILTTPLTADAQRASKLPRVGVLSPYMSASDPFLGAFRQGLRELGYVATSRVRTSSWSTVPQRGPAIDRRGWPPS